MLLRMGFCSRMALTELSVCEKESFLCILFCELPVNYDHFFQGCLPFFHDNARFVKKVSICVVAILFLCQLADFKKGFRILNDSSNNDRYLKDSLRDFHVGVSWFESSAGREDEKKVFLFYIFSKEVIIFKSCQHVRLFIFRLLFTILSLFKS